MTAATTAQQYFAGFFPRPMPVQELHLVSVLVWMPQLVGRESLGLVQRSGPR